MALKSQEISQIATNMLNVPINVAKTLSNALSVSILQNNPLKPNEIENLLIQTLNSYPALVGA